MQSKKERLSSPTSLLRKLSNSPRCCEPHVRAAESDWCPRRPALRATAYPSHIPGLLPIMTILHGQCSGHTPGVWPVELVLLDKASYHQVVENCQRPHSPGVGGAGQTFSLGPHHLPSPPLLSALPHCTPLKMTALFGYMSKTSGVTPSAHQSVYICRPIPT